MADEFSGYADGPAQSARNLAAVTPHDTDELATVTKGLYVGGAGNIAIIAADDNTAVTLTAVPAGSILPIRARIVKSTGTTATAIVALF